MLSTSSEGAILGPNPLVRAKVEDIVTECVFPEPYIFQKEDSLYVYNASRTIKIINKKNRIVRIKTAAGTNQPTIFDIGKLKKSTYLVQVADKQISFQKV